MAGVLLITFSLGPSACRVSAQGLNPELLGRSLDRLVGALQTSDVSALEPLLDSGFRVGEFSGGMARSIIGQVVASGRIQPEYVRVDSVQQDGEHHRVYVTLRAPSGDRAHDLLVTAGGLFVEINVMNVKRVEATSQTRPVGGGRVQPTGPGPMQHGSPGPTDPVLRDRLIRMLADDQEHRRAGAALRDTADPVEEQRLMDLQGVADSANVAALVDILETRGWPGPTLVGAEASMAAFLVLQHAPPGVQRQYLPMAREAVRSGDLAPAHFVLLEDRVRMHQGQPQLYGTQLTRDAATGRLELWPVEDEAAVDIRRAGVGLPPLADYLRGFGLEYRPPR